MTEIVLHGLDAGNPLAFLASLGVLRVTTLAYPDAAVAMRWAAHDGGWRPLLAVDQALDAPGKTAEQAWLSALGSVLHNPVGHEPFAVANDLTIAVPHFRALAFDAARRAKPEERRFADFLAAFGSDAVESRVNGKKTGEVADTALRTMSGAGHQHFLGFMRTLAADVREEHLRRALLHVWQYDDPVESHTMRWDPVDDVRYALRWRNSSGDPERKRSGAMWGANRLAIEALPLLPTAPVGVSLETTGFSHRRSEGVTWTWPVWTALAGVDTVRSLLSMSELQHEVPDRRRLASMGVAEVYRSRRITQGKYRNFTPAFPV